MMTTNSNDTKDPSNDSFKASFADLLEASTARTQELREGEIISGTIVSVGRDTVVVDIGYKSEGVIPLAEFIDTDGQPSVKVGDKVDVLIESRENSDGLVALSKQNADRLKVWDELNVACAEEQVITGTITDRIKGGLAVTIRGGVQAFLPGSQVDLRPVRNLDSLMGQTMEFKVIKFNPKRGNIVLSRRVLLEKERDHLKTQTLDTLSEGQVVTGIIKGITEYGAFVDLGGIDGLLHITDMSWGRVNHPSELLSVNQEVEVKVLKYNSDSERVSLGLKQMTDDPWLKAGAKYAVGSRVEGKVVSLTDYGAFVELESGLEGLIHVTEMTWTKPKHPSKVLEMGQEVECVVLDIDIQNKRISLGLKQLQPNPWEAFTQKYSPGDIVRGEIRSLTDYGVFIGVQEGVDGMAHKSDLSWTHRIDNPADFYRKGDEVEAIILSINHEEQKVSLGLKQLYEDPWSYIPTRYQEGTVLEVRVAAVDEDRVRAELERGVEGIVPRAEVTGDLSVEPSQVVKVGDLLKAVVTRVDQDERELMLSFKEAGNKELDEKMKFVADQAPPKKAATASTTLGDVFKDKLGSLVENKAEEASVESE